MSTTPTPPSVNRMVHAADQISNYESIISALAAGEPDLNARYFYRAAANALGRVRRAYVKAETTDVPTGQSEGKTSRSCAPGVAEDQGGAA